MQGIIFAYYSHTSTATTHCFPHAYTSYLWLLLLLLLFLYLWYHLTNVSQVKISDDEL